MQLQAFQQVKVPRALLGLQQPQYFQLEGWPNQRQQGFHQEALLQFKALHLDPNQGCFGPALVIGLVFLQLLGQPHQPVLDLGHLNSTDDFQRVAVAAHLADARPTA